MTTTSDSFNQKQLRSTLGAFVTGVTVITTCDAGSGTLHGVTANSFSSVSLDPPLVLWSQSLTSKSFPAFQNSEHFAINILADDQIELSNHFGKSRDEKFRDIEYDIGIGGIPVLRGTAAHLECVKVATYPGGDHVVYLGRVMGISQSGRRPLAFGGGKYMVAYSHDLGPVSLQLGTSTPAQLEAVRLVTQAMPDLAESVGQHTLCLAVWGNHGPTAVYWQPSSRPVSDQLRLGLVMPVTRSATGRAFSAFLPQETTEALINEDLRLFRTDGEDDLLQRTRFNQEMESTKQHGLARVVNTGASPVHQVQVNAFSVPIFDGSGQMLMALSLTSPASRLSPDWDGPVPQALKQAANELSGKIANL